jgi:glycosyltransferase involved in cell wall biosynthesis
MRILLVTDAWSPQVNGVVRTLQTTCEYLGKKGHQVHVIHPGQFRTLPCTTYPDIRLAIFPGRGVAGVMEAFEPEAIHIATEGPLGLSARRWCLDRDLPFTTSFHTQFPEYLRLRAPVPTRWTYALLQRFHEPAVRTLVPTPTQRNHLEARGFGHLRLWSRGVDTTVFHPEEPFRLPLPGPIAIYMGRVAVEKNIESFLNLDLPGSKVVIGDGPDLARLRQQFPSAHFMGPLFGRDLARHLAGGDVFVFPSRTDTFGLVLLEAMACGLPVAAYPVQGPLDVISHGISGFLSEDLREAVLAALLLDRSKAVALARTYAWDTSVDTFISHLAPVAESHRFVAEAAPPFELSPQNSHRPKPVASLGER